MSRADANLVRAAVAGLRPGASGWVRADCPFCPGKVGREGKRKLNYNTATGGYICLRCHSKGWAGSEDQHHVRIWDVNEAPAEIAPPEGYYPLGYGPGATAEVFAPAREYAARRIPPSMWTDLGIGATVTGYHAHRIVIPVLDRDERTWLGWVARTWLPTAARKYLYPEGMRTSQILYNSSALEAFTDAPILVVEGVLDAIHLWPDAVAAFGKPGERHLEMLHASPRPVCFVLDGDAWEEAKALAWRMRFGGKIAGMVKLPPKVDPDEIEPARLRELAAQSLHEEL